MTTHFTNRNSIKTKRIRKNKILELAWYHQNEW